MMGFKLILVLHLGSAKGHQESLHWEMGIMRRGSLGETGGLTLTTIFDNCATCSWEKLTMLNPQLVAGEQWFV